MTALDPDTLEALDWGSVLSALSEHARTPMGRAAATTLEALPDLGAITRTMDMVEEILLLERDGGWVNVGAVGDVANPVARAGKGAVLDTDELRRSGVSLRAAYDLGAMLLGTDHHVPVLVDLAPTLQVDSTVLEVLEDAFDELGQLSARTFPVLAELRQRIASLHVGIRNTLEQMVRGDTLTDLLQDRYITQRGDRYVLPIKANSNKRELGIIHGTSGSGQTAFIEPHEVVALNNDLRIAEGELEAAIRRILAHLSATLGRVSEPGLAALEAALEIDLACARASFARLLDATRPIVREQGVIHLTDARHPVLALRQIDVVPNDLALSAVHPILVVSGPNTGGKTIALKTFGLCVLLVGIGCFVPAAEESRVDRFPVVRALIGDHQTVHGDQSSFSSHMIALQEMLDHATAGCLYLVDEIASGTDPHQGAALAHALLEEMLERGPRVVVTTHFTRLKTVNAIDKRFSIAALQFRDGVPTYKLLPDLSGESHALSLAERVGFSPDILARARELMHEGERALADTVAALEVERGRAETATRRAAELAAEMSAQTSRLAAREARVAARAKELEQEGAAAYLQRLARAEAAIAGVVADLQRNPGHQQVDAARRTVATLRGLVPAAEAASPAPAPERTLAVGDRVRLTKLGSVGEVVAIKGNNVQVSSGGLAARVKLADLELLGTALPRPPRPVFSDAPPRVHTPLGAALRHAGNTVDLRGKRVDEALEATEAYLDKAMLRRHAVVFILHGHGTGAMKQAIRKWLPSCAYIASWAPANVDQGGDAYTVAALT